MKKPSALAALRQRQSTLAQSWHARSRREQRWIACGALAIGAAVVYLALIAPALQARARLQRALPQLRLQSTQLLALAAQAAALPAAAAPDPLSRKLLEDALRPHGIQAKGIDVADDSVRLQFDDTPFASLLAGLDALQKSQQLVVVDASFGVASGPGLVKASVQLRRTNGDRPK